MTRDFGTRDTGLRDCETARLRDTGLRDFAQRPMSFVTCPSSFVK